MPLSPARLRQLEEAVVEFGLCKRLNLPTAFLPTAFFFPEGDETPYLALSICRKCPMQEECRAVAVNHPQIPHGVWGGMEEKELRRIWRRMKRGI